MISKQSSLFGDIGFEKPKTESLKIAGGPNRPLTKGQRTFNRLIARINNLRLKLADTARDLDRALAYHGEHLRPREIREEALRKELIRVLLPFLSGPLKKKRDRQTLRSVLRVQLDALLQRGPLQEEDLRAAFKKVHGLSIEEAEKQGMDGMRSALDAMFDDLGVDIDLSDLRSNMTEAEMAAKIAEMDYEFERAQETARDGGNVPKSKKQIAREERERKSEELRKRSIATIYRQLAKVLHPDLEQDPRRREEKSILMQKLTAAYRENDLHTILGLELEWIHREEGDISRLTEEKIGIYNEILKEQVAELELELEELPCHPRYQPIVVYGPFGIEVKTDSESQARELDELIATMERSLELLHSEKAHATVLGIICEYRASERLERELSRMMRRQPKGIDSWF
jgi:hypothetical protein